MSGKSAKERERYFIRLKEGQLFTVTREIYLCWYGCQRHERYQVERDIQHGTCSYEGLLERINTDENGYGFDILADAQDVAELAIRKILKERLHCAMQKLRPDEVALIQALFYEEMSMRSYAKRVGVTHRAIQKRKERILRVLKGVLEEEE